MVVVVGPMVEDTFDEDDPLVVLTIDVVFVVKNVGLRVVDATESD